MKHFLTYSQKLHIGGGGLPPHFKISRINTVNDSYCAQPVTGILVPFQTGQTGASVSSVMRDQKLKVTGKDCFSKTRTQLPVSYHVVSHVPFAGGSPQKKGVIPEHQRSIKSVKGVSCVNSLEFYTKCHKCPTCCTKSSCRVKIAQVLGKMGSPRRQPQSGCSP